MLATILNIDSARDQESYWKPEVIEEEMDCEKEWLLDIKTSISQERVANPAEKTQIKEF